MVKNDALFSYIAPTNIFAWLLMPLRYVMTLRQFVWLNRTIIKITHFPILFCIFLYEKFWLAPSMYEPTDLVENPGRDRARVISFADPAARAAMFSPSIRVREESVAGFQKDRALEEVFRLEPDPLTLRTQRRQERRKTQTAIRNWMDQHDETGTSPANWPTLDSGAVPPWQRRMSMGWGERISNLRQVSDVRSTASDPADLISNSGAPWRTGNVFRPRSTREIPEYKDQTDADGDDELVTNDEDEDDNATNLEGTTDNRRDTVDEGSDEGYFNLPVAAGFGKLASSVSSAGRRAPPTPRPRRGGHSRTMSSTTILFNPQELKHGQSQSHSSASASASGTGAQSRPRTSGRNAGEDKAPRHSTSPRRVAYQPATMPRPVVQTRGMTEIGGVSRSALMSIEPRNRPREARRLSSVDLSAMSDNTNMPFGGDDPNAVVPGSFQTQMAMAMMKDNRLRAAGGGDSADRDRMGRLVLARMKTLEEGFAEVIQEMRNLKNSSTNNSSTAPTTRRNSSGEEPRLGALVEVAGRDRTRRYKVESGHQKKASTKRPMSRRSLKEPKAESWDTKGKGKQVAHSSEEDDETEDDNPHKGGSL